MEIPALSTSSDYFWNRESDVRKISLKQFGFTNSQLFRAITAVNGNMQNGQ
jgi:hypothetical protein